MRNGHSKIAIVLDRSGSMESVREATVSGLNEFIGAQKKGDGTADVLLVRFDNQYEVVFDLPLSEVPVIGLEDLEPRGTTALLDAVGKTIVDVGRVLSATVEADRPGKVIVVILTDGLENASKEYSKDQIAAIIQHQRDVYNWEFIFLGANQDAVLVGASMNIPAHAALTYSADPNAMRAAIGATSKYVLARRVSAPAAFSPEDRKAAMPDKKPQR